MAPAKKRSVNRQFLNEDSPEKDVKYSHKNKERANGKRKLPKLGPQWSKGELQRFYRAYRGYGKDWKKVAAELQNRSVEMVEALYHMNQAYLSLPDGTASVLGLIAMMTDHYNCMEGSDSEGEGNDAQEFSRKSLKRKREKIQVSVTKEEKSSSHIGGSINGCMSLLKTPWFDGDYPRAVGKRTPRVPVKKDDGEIFVSPKKVQKSEIDSYDDEGMHVAALALTNASQKRSSPQVRQTLNRTSQHFKSSAVRSSDRMLYDDSVRKDWSEGGVGSEKPCTSNHCRDTSSMMEIDCIGAAKVHRKQKKLRGNRVKVEEIGNNYSDDVGEACSGTEVEKVVSFKREAGSKVSNAKKDEDDVSDLDPLQTLAHISLLESESSIQLSDENNEDVEDSYGAPEVYLRPSGLNKLLREHDKSNLPIIGVEDVISRKSKPGTPELGSEVKQRSQSINYNSAKRKTETVISKALNSGEGSIGSHRSRHISTEEDKNASAVKSKRAIQITPPSKESKSIRSPDNAFLAGAKHVKSNLLEPAARVPGANQVITETRKLNRRKMSLKRALKSKEQMSSGNLKNDTTKSTNLLNKELLQQTEKLSSCLSYSMVRRWCMFEWFYSAIDYPWFAKREFVEYLTHVGLGHIPRLTRVEWGVIRSSLGKPRRFSDRFLSEEREKFEQYRESARKHYSELRSGVREGLPTDLVRPLTVGQRVIAVDPKTRELYDGSVLTVDHDKCRVQFDSADIGVEVVKDVDCMPLNPFDNMPEALKRQRLSVFSNEPANGYLDTGGFTSNGHIENTCHPLNFVKQLQMDAITSVPKPKATTVNAVKSHQVTGTHPFALAQNKVTDASMQACTEMNPAFNKRGTLINQTMEILNNEVNSGKEPDAFKKQLIEADDQAKSARISAEQQLKSRSVSVLPPWLKPLPNSISSANLPGYRDQIYSSQESRSNVDEIIYGSKQEARTMVDTAVQTISTVGEGDDAYVKIKEALASFGTRRLTSESKMNVTRMTEHASTVQPPANGRASEPLSLDKSDKIEAAIPSDLITSCVSAVLMIQKCAERQHPPADVAQIIEFVNNSFHLCCPENSHLLRDIQMYMRRIKTLLLALIPT